MEKEYITILNDGNGEYEEKKSRFLGYACHVESEEEVQEVLQSIRKKYYDARHNCYAYILGVKGEIRKASDDGEPSGTAGYPILSVLEGSGAVNTLIVVTRYFGGTLLGTGGLVRSYTKSAQAALSDARPMKKMLADKLVIRTDYNGLGKIQYLLAKEELPQPEVTYFDRVEMQVPVPVDRTREIIKKITDATSGKAETDVLEQVYFAKRGNEILFFDR